MAGKRMRHETPGKFSDYPPFEKEGSTIVSNNQVGNPVFAGDKRLDHFFAVKVTGPRDLPVSTWLASDRGPYLTVRQVHGDDLLVVDPPVSPERTDAWSPWTETVSLTEADGLLTNHRGVGLAVLTADCVPILLFDPGRHVIGAVHAGWRGTVKGVLEKAVQRMTDRFGSDPSEILAAMGPAIGPCCYEVGDEVLRQFQENRSGQWEGHYIPSGRQRHGRLDLAGLNRRQLIQMGLSTDHIFNMGLCTACRPDLFHSFRRDGVGTGRMVSGIRMR